MCNRKTVFAEISAEISGRKNCKEAIFALAGQALLRKNHILGAAKPPLRIKVEGVATPPSHPGAFDLVQQPRWLCRLNSLFSQNDNPPADVQQENSFC